VVALLLFGIVWVNVAKLGLTTQTGAVVERSRAIEAQNLRLETRLERRDATVIDRAREDLGMIPSSGESVTYVQAR
jgi:cell division protein FtsL